MKTQFSPKTWIVGAVSFGLVAQALAGCADMRPLEKLKDPEHERVLKSALTGPGPEPMTWASKVTVVRTSTNGGLGFAGLQSEMKLGRFEFTSGKLKFLSVVTPYAADADTAPELINEWDITHHDVKLSESDGNVTNREEEDEDKPWREKRYFKIDFSSANISEASTFPYYVDAAEADCLQRKAAHLVDDTLEIAPDHVNFVVGVDYQLNSLCNSSMRRGLRSDYTYTIEYRYSFKKLERSSYQPYAYKSETDPLMKKYGYFQTVLERINPTTGEFQNTILMNRWDPRKTHHYFFAKDTPESLKWIFADPEKGIIAKTNKLFEKHGLPTRFEIHENTWGDGKVKEFGDLRYSFIKIVEEMSGDAPLGYGPSDANPLTGEIVAANLIIWVGDLKYYLDRIEGTLDREPTKFEDSSLFNRMKSVLHEDDASKWTNEMTFDRGAGKAFNELLPDLTFGYPYWSRFTTHGPQSEPIFRFTNRERLASLLRNDAALARVSDAQASGKEFLEREARELKRASSSTIYPADPHLADARAMLIAGKTPKEIIDTILYRVSIHEFGHNLNLRHNFYGSIDEKNFSDITIPSSEDGGQASAGKSTTSSVMEYLALRDEIHLNHDWESYDEAAIAFAYSGGKDDSAKQHLFCTDEHRALNALCNVWDRGTTPSQVVMSLVETYEDTYPVLNYRGRRAFWNTSGYQSRIFSTMWAIKKFLPLWRAGFNEDVVRRELDRRGELSDHEITEVVRELSKDMKQAVKLSLAFYNAVVQQSAADRPWSTEYEPWSGDIKRIGIMYDKIFAMMFLMGDDGFAYNPNRQMSAMSYLAYSGEPELRQITETLFENALTERVDMEPWFIGYARALYAMAATNVYNRDDLSLINRIKVVRLTDEDLTRHFGINVTGELDTETLTLSRSSHPYFRQGEEVGIARVDDRYYMVSKFRNPYAFDIIQKIKDDMRFGNSTVQSKADLKELNTLYRLVLQELE